MLTTKVAVGEKHHLPKRSTISQSPEVPIYIRKTVDPPGPLLLWDWPLWAALTLEAAALGHFGLGAGHFRPLRLRHEYFVEYVEHAIKLN